jgi:homoserine kinase
LGPGLDSFGLALGLYHELTLRTVDTHHSPTAIELSLEGEGARTLPDGDDNAIVQALRAALEAAAYDGPDLRVHSANAIPLARGLGSSAAAFLAGSAAGQLLSLGRVDEDRLLTDGWAAEGHGDNVAPCIRGGFTIVTAEEGQIECHRFGPPTGLAVVLGVPAFELSTATSRTSLPDSVSRGDAVHAASRAGLVAAGLAAGRLDLLARGMAHERLHEPYRSAQVPGLAQVRRAALAAGAYGAALSGAGPSVLALVPAATEVGARVGEAMKAAWQEAGVASQALPLPIDADGLQAEKLPGDAT